MERLRKHAIDLADLVAEERMTLVEGLAALKVREDAKRQEQEILRQERVLRTGNFIAALRTLNPSPADPGNQADHILEIFDSSVATLKVSKTLLKGCANVLMILSLKWKDDERDAHHADTMAGGRVTIASGALQNQRAKAQPD